MVSGRSRYTLERWLGELPIHLHAEHGLWSRAPGQPGQAVELPPLTWRDRVLAILRDYAERTPGSLVEEKPMGLAWHYRAADPEYGAVQANELQLHLKEMLSNTPVEIVPGEKVIEIRAHGINKGRIVPAILARLPGALIVAIGDDRTDEDLFAALAPRSRRRPRRNAEQPRRLPAAGRLVRSSIPRSAGGPASPTRAAIPGGLRERNVVSTPEERVRAPAAWCALVIVLDSGLEWPQGRAAQGCGTRGRRLLGWSGRQPMQRREVWPPAEMRDGFMVIHHPRSPGLRRMRPPGDSSPRSSASCR